MNNIIIVIVTYILIISIVSSFLKGMSFSYFYLNTYEMLNKKWNSNIIKILAFVFITLEFFIPLLTLLNLKLNLFSIIGMIGLYIIPTLLLISSIIKGDKNTECGCFGVNFKVKITWNKVIQNLIYIVILVYSLFIPKDTIELWNIILAIILSLLYFLIIKMKED
ncbi:MauE/DoxX family redox-associated membrane protein [Staphylococcus equorum]|uniref:MauE/DoxX family redox-associated membrane protein n=1 Tax=Staphylococcus equorum TaxID=246432 RepID=UPI000E67680A|nr:MauE/DoxX family redox-associated membrane protein [Staphylococcus equorum]RIL38257.1 hypothetical protein BUY84_09260 [Staphylococcus equorum]